MLFSLFAIFSFTREDGEKADDGDGSKAFEIERLKETNVEAAIRQREKVMEDMKNNPELVEYALPSF